MAQIYGEQPGREVTVNSWLKSAALEMLLEEAEVTDCHLSQPKKLRPLLLRLVLVWMVPVGFRVRFSSTLSPSPYRKVALSSFSSSCDACFQCTVQIRHIIIWLNGLRCSLFPLHGPMQTKRPGVFFHILQWLPAWGRMLLSYSSLALDILHHFSACYLWLFS